MVGGELPDAPYPADLRARGWRFELDLERIHQSATWKLAPSELRPWLLMLWAQAWASHPIGTLDKDDAVVAATIGMPLTMYQTHREVLMRGWYRCNDGRMYHPVISERVKEMLEHRKNERQRVARWRAEKSAAQQENAAETTSDGVTRNKRVTNAYVRVSTTPEPEPEPKNVKSNARSPRASPSPAGPLPPGFQRFWQAYPNHNGRRRDRKACLDLWRKQGLELLAEPIVSHVEAMKRTAAWRPNAAGESFEREAIRYLRNRNWEDGLPAEPRRTGVVA